jgi:hypothetical protein
MSKGSLISTLRRTGTRNFKSTLRRIESIALPGDVANGSNQEIYTRKMEENMASAVVARQKYAVYATGNGMAQRTAPRMKKPIDFLRRRKNQVGSDAIIAELWSS